MIVVQADGVDPAIQARATRLAEELGLPLSLDDGGHAPTSGDVVLAVTGQRLELRSVGRRVPGPVHVDFVGGPVGYRRRLNRQGMLFRAVGLRLGKPTVVDATAGLGRDAFLLAYYGCRVTAVERSPIVAALLRDGFERASAEVELQERLADRLQIVCADAREWLRRLPAIEAPEVVYLDPMYPARGGSALAKKEMRVLRQVVGDDPDAGELYEAARSIAQQRVVVKRPRLAAPIAPDPTRQYVDKTTRYDVYSTRA